MFDKLRGAFAGVAKSLGEKELKEKDIDDALFELEIALLESDVASEVIDSIKADLKKDLIGSRVEKSRITDAIKSSLISSISSLFDSAGRVDLLDMISRKKASGEPFLILFVGINGTGKTTTLAKVAHMLQQSKYSVVVAASDTFRAGAIEQLKEHTKRLNLKLVAQNYNSDPAAVARDAVLYAKAHRTDCVLIDTAGRMQTSKNLMEQIAKITKVVDPDVKIFVGDSLAGNDTVSQAREFYEHTKFDAAILTKADADARGGAALSIAKVASTPILYVGVGQEYADLRPFDKKVFLEMVFGEDGAAGADYEAPAASAAQAGGAERPEEAEEEAMTEEPDAAEEAAGADADVAAAKDAEESGHAEHKVEEDEVDAPQEPPPAAPAEPASEAPPRAERRESPPEAELPSGPEPVSESEPDVQKAPGIEELEPEDTAPPTPPSSSSPPPSSSSPPPSSSSPPPSSSSPPPSSSSDDPFHGIADSDIAEYSDRFDVPPPENDKEAYVLAERIRRWIAGGRPDPGDDYGSETDGDGEEEEEGEGEDGPDYDGSDVEEDAHKDYDGGAGRNGKKAGQESEQQDKNDMPKKKRRFGFFRKG